MSIFSFLFGSNQNSNQNKPKLKVDSKYSIENAPQNVKDVWDQIEATKIENVVIDAKPGKANNPIQSKFGGKVYLPKGEAYPLGKNNKPMIFIAQLNFAEIPALKDFPENGLLQFFVADDDNYLYGSNFDNFAESDFVIKFYDNPQGLEFIEQEELMQKTSPVKGEFVLEFKKEMMPMSFGDFRWNIEFVGDENFDSIDWYCRHIEDEKHRIGGYPFFTQTDPRAYDHNDKFKGHTTLLFQMQSQYEKVNNNEIMWGDMGVCNFFIKPEDLRNKDFTNVLYNWDCS